MQMILKFVVILCIFCISACSDLTLPASKDKARIIVLTRHAEKLDESKDPPLTDQGMERGGAIAYFLKSTPLDAVYATPYSRVRHTLQPSADRFGLAIQEYSVDTLWEFAMNILKNTNGNILIGGHSNSTPDLANFLIGDSIYSEIPHEDYTRLYLLHFEGSRFVSSQLVHIK
jgi:phosphohistidine phosphatase SixA